MEEKNGIRKLAAPDSFTDKNGAQRLTCSEIFCRFIAYGYEPGPVFCDVFGCQDAILGGVKAEELLRLPSISQRVTEIKAHRFQFPIAGLIERKAILTSIARNEGMKPGAAIAAVSELNRMERVGTPDAAFQQAGQPVINIVVLNGDTQAVLEGLGRRLGPGNSAQLPTSEGQVIDSKK